MTLSVDLNADMGEGFGPWRMGDDAALLDVVTSANIACGFHAGDPDVMAATMAAAAARGVGIGAHPGFADLQGFGRRRMDLPRDSLTHMIQYQIGAAQAMARAAGAELAHIKLHGALANMTSEDADMARTCFEAALSVAPDTPLMVIAGTAQETAARHIGCKAACEIFADRAYAADGTLLSRALPGAVLHDPEEIAARVVQMVQSGAITTQCGKTIDTRIDTICLHGDSPDALRAAQATRAALEAAGIALAPLTGAVL